MSEEKRETFLARIARGWRLTVYEPVRESLHLEMGDILRVTVQVEKRKNDGVVTILCESGAHITGLIPHRKEQLGDGWARYTCLICNKKTPMLISKAEGG